MKYFLIILTSLVLIYSNIALSEKTLDWQAHRGGRGLFPENTIDGMLKSLNFPITTLEMDVVISKDLEVVVSHEPWMSTEICTDAQGHLLKEQQINLYKMTYAEIAQFECGLKMHPRFPKQEKVKAFKPKLVDLIGAVEGKTKKIQYSIEIKSTIEEEKNGFQPNFQQFTDLVVGTLKKNIPLERVILQSFDWRVLDYLHLNYPKIRTSALIEEKYDVHSILKKLKSPPTIFSPDFNLLTKSDVDFLHAQKIQVIPWTLNSKTEIEKAKAMGVDGIITDYPDLIK